MPEVQEKGAVGAIVSDKFQGTVEGLPLLKVPDVLLALQRLAQHRLSELPMKIVAITGSVGKTTTKDFTSTLLAEKYRIASFKGNPNSQIGLPTAILNADFFEKEVLIVEMGMELPGEIARLTQIAPPDIGLITMTAFVCGAKNFDSLEAVGRAKAEIFSHPRTKLGILSHEIVNFDELCPLHGQSFSVVSPEADFYLKENSKGFTINGIEFDSLPVPGKHNLSNFLAACSVARNMGLSWEEIRRGASKLALPERRFQICEINGATFVNDSYNASVVSVNAALMSLPMPQAGGKKIACIGELPGLGPFSENCHREVGKKALEHVDLMLCLGEGCAPIINCWKEANRPAYLFQDRIRLVDALRTLFTKGDVILLKGGNLKQMWKVLEEL